MTQPDPNAQAAAQQAQAATQQGQQQTAPPWGSDAEFDPAKAWKLIEDLRADKEKLSGREVLTPEQKARLAEYEKHKKETQTELEKAQGDATRWQTETETWRSAAVAATVKALAGADFADPDDAVRNLDPSKYLDAGGTIDERQIKADLEKLLEKKPHYKRDGEPQGPRAPKPNLSQGSGVNGRSAPDPAQEFAAIMQGQLGGA